MAVISESSACDSTSIADSHRLISATVRVTEARHGTTASCDVVYRTQPGRQFDVGVIRNMMIAKDRTGIQHLNIGRVKEGKLKDNDDGNIDI